MEECAQRWEAWTPEGVAGRLVGISVPWCVVGGWALDLFVGTQTRDHEDLEIAVPRERFGEVAAAFGGYEWDVVGSGMVWAYRDAGDRAEFHQTWLRDPATGKYHLDVFREPHDGERWICRREPSITLPYTDLIEIGRAGIPYVIPEVALLFKAKAQRPKDQQDFDRVTPLLPDHRVARLAAWLARVHPHHDWLETLSGGER
ncbi:hypothetical protein JMUB6875_61150 [Nocardia sp. JMUB6875]